MIFSDKTVLPAISVIQDIGEIVSVFLRDIINSTFSAILSIVSVLTACHVLIDVCVCLCVVCCPSATSSLSRCVFLGLNNNGVRNYHNYYDVKKHYV